MNHLTITIYHSNEEAPDTVNLVLQSHGFSFVRDIDSPWKRGVIEYWVTHPKTGEELLLSYELEHDEWFTVD